MLQKPFLLINSPVFLQDVPVSIQEDVSISIQEDVPVSIQEEELPQEELLEGVIVVEELESPTIDRDLINHQLRFLARNNRFSRPLKIKLHNSDEIIGHIVSLEDNQVTVEVNGERNIIDGNDILKIGKF